MGQYAHVSTNLSLYSISGRPCAEKKDLLPPAGQELNIISHTVFGSLLPLLYSHRSWNSNTNATRGKSKKNFLIT